MGPLKVLKVPDVVGGRMSYLLSDEGGEEAVGRKGGDISVAVDWIVVSGFI